MSEVFWGVYGLGLIWKWRLLMLWRKTVPSRLYVHIWLKEYNLEEMMGSEPKSYLSGGNEGGGSAVFHFPHPDSSCWSMGLIWLHWTLSDSAFSCVYFIVWKIYCGSPEVCAGLVDTTYLFCCFLSLIVTKMGPDIGSFISPKPHCCHY